MIILSGFQFITGDYILYRIYVYTHIILYLSLTPPPPSLSLSHRLSKHCKMVDRDIILTGNNGICQHRRYSRVPVKRDSASASQTLLTSE